MSRRDLMRFGAGGAACFALPTIVRAQDKTAISIYDLGGEPDLDDNAPLAQAALDDGLTLYIPAGKWHFRSPLRVWDNNSIVGDGGLRSHLRFLDSGGIVPADDSQNTTYVSLQGLYIRGSIPHTGIWALRSSRWVYRDLFIDGFRTNIRIDGTPHPMTGVRGAILHNLFNVTSSQPARRGEGYHYGLHCTGGDSGKAELVNWYGGYIQGELISDFPANVPSLVFFQYGQANNLYGVNFSGGRNGVSFNDRHCSVIGGYGQICNTLFRFTPRSQENTVRPSLARTARHVGRYAVDKGVNNDW